MASVKIYVATYKIRRWKLTEARKRDVAGNHESRMEVEQFTLVFQAVALFVVDDPEDGQHDGSEKENRREDHDENVLAPWAALPSRFVIFIVTPKTKANQGMFFFN